MTEKKEVLVLFSGGIDSSACIYYYKQLGFHVQGLFVDYEQKSSKNEKIAVKKLSKHFNIYTPIIKINTNPTVNNGVIQGRNYLLLSIALMNFPFIKGLISLGIHSGTNYIDCTTEFVKKTQKIFDLYTNGNITIDCPFINFTKREIYEYCKTNKLPLHSTYSCENGAKIQPCGKCSTCKDLIVLYELKD